MIVRSLAAACCAVVALAVPAQAQGCTGDYVRDVVDASPFLVTGPSPHPIAEVGPDGSIHVYPQNVAPAVGGLAGGIVGFVQAVPGLTTTYVDCVV